MEKRSPMKQGSAVCAQPLWLKLVLEALVCGNNGVAGCEGCRPNLGHILQHGGSRLGKRGIATFSAAGHTAMAGHRVHEFSDAWQAGMQLAQHMATGKANQLATGWCKTSTI